MYKQTVISKNVTIASGESFSEMVDCGSMQLVALATPPELLATQIKFYVSLKPVFSTAKPVTYIDNTEFLIASSSSVTGNHYPVIPYYFIGTQYIWISVNTPPAEDTVLELLIQPLFQGIHG